MTSNLDKRFRDKSLTWLLALLLALAVTAPMLTAQEWDHWDHFNGRDKVHDPTGAWLINSSAGGFFLMVFHKGGTLTGDRQGESAFDPSAVNPPKPNLNVIATPLSGVWQKTGWNIFAATLLAIEYEVQANGAAPLFRFDKAQMVGRLTESGDGMTFTGLITLFDEKGNQLEPKEGIPFPGNGVRIPVEILPHTANTLPIPPIPQ
jgi:hypothetical protein